MKNVKKIILITVTTSAALFAGRDPLQKFESYELESTADSFSYTIGMDMAQQLSTLDDRYISVEAIVSGIVNSRGEDAVLLSEDEKRSVQQRIIGEIQVLEQEKQELALVENFQNGIDFLEENGKREGVITTESGLQYEIIEEGSGERPTASQTVTVHYVGTTIDGKEFDSSVRRGSPATFPLQNVIKGWTEGVQLMPVGSKYNLYIPSELGYGERGAGADIGPNSALIFEIELISIQ